MGFFKKLFGKDKEDKKNYPPFELEITKQVIRDEAKFKIEATIQGHSVKLLADTLDEEVDLYWVNIYVDGKRYGYSPDIDKWSIHKTGVPPDNKELAGWIKTQIEKFIPAPLPEGSIKTTYRNEGKTKYSLKGEVDEKIIWAYLKPEGSIFEVNLGGKWKYDCNKAKNIIPERLAYMEKTLIKWLNDEYKRYNARSK
ncbi:hypothetical protein MNBD_DELTA01-243 [hydrothermal vent metagenome]|uniref:Uncharacterized protein n=1 Tax=hydrothermal vent metagenome TaxID=652676 RepID=A0A3B0RHA8_9ZZZZ